MHRRRRIAPGGPFCHRPARSGKRPLIDDPGVGRLRGTGGDDITKGRKDAFGGLFHKIRPSRVAGGKRQHSDAAEQGAHHRLVPGMTIKSLG
jgi:hypothetical protein